jgi:hypothetical protein
MGIIQTTNKLTGTLRRVWRYAGSPSNGTSGTFAGQAEKGDLLIDSTNAKLYMNTNTTASPTWTENAQTAGSGASIGVVGDMAANGTSTANAAGVGTTAAAIDHVHKLGTHDHSDNTKGGTSIGAVTIASMTLSGDIDMSGQVTGTYDFILKDAVADALSIRRASTDIIVFDTATPRVTITPVVTITGALTASAGIGVTTGGITVSAGGITVTGTSSITGDVTITGDVIITGDLTWGGTFTLDELILDSDGAAPAGTLTYIVSDNTGDVTINALTGKEIHLAINGNDEYDFNATAFQLASANNIQFLGNNGILDSNGNEVILVEAVGSATTYLNVKNANDAAIALECLGGVDKGFIFYNDQDEEILTLTPVASALYNLNLMSAASGGKPTIQTEGAVDIGIDFETSESEEMLSLIPVASAITYITITSAITGVAPSIGTAGENDIGIKFVNAEGEEMLVLASAATAVTYIQIASSATATAPIISSQGGDDIAIAFHNNQAEEILTLTPIATGIDYIDIKSGDGSTMPTISTAGDTAAVDLVLAPKGTGAVIINNGTDPVILKLMGAQAGYNNEIHDVNGNELIDLQGVASAVCEIGISNAVAGSPAIIKSQGETNSNLMIDTSGTGQITIALGGDEVLKLHDAAAMTFVAATDTAGHPIYIQTEDGGTDGGAASTGKAGGLLHISSGDGSAAVTTDAVGGAGGALSLVTGVGGVADGTGVSGAGGAVAITAGAGGASSGATGTGGVGGSITLTAGAGGAGTGGIAGAGGKVIIGAGVFAQKVQTIDMADAAVQLTMVPNAPNGTLMTGNILYVDAASSGTENLLLPYEADCIGMMLMIVNTGGETINLQNDAGGAVLTIATAEVGFVACDGTTWLGFVGVA